VNPVNNSKSQSIRFTIGLNLRRALIQEQIADEPVFSAKSEFSNFHRGFLTEKQSQVLHFRSRGFTQREIAAKLKISRASVSMIEGRARSQVRRARLTIEFFELIQNQYEVSTESGTKLQQIPMIVLQEADRHKIHLRSNMVEILRMVKKLKADSLSSDGRVNEKLIFSFNERGKLYLR
jgi:hypothetical protein